MATRFRHKSFDELPALAVRGRSLRDSLRLVTLAWMFGIVWMSLITGSQMTNFQRLMGFGYWSFGIMAAIPNAAALAQLVMAVIVERTGLRKSLFMLSCAIHRMLWVVIAILPIVFKPGLLAVSVFLTIYAISCILAQASTPPWWNWMGDLIPRRIRGRYFANRTMWTVPLQIITALSAGFLLDKLSIPGAPLTQAAQPALVRAICIMFAVAGILGTMDILTFLRIREIVSPPLIQGAAAERKGGIVRLVLVEPMRVVTDSMRDKAFRRYALYGATMALGVSVSDQFFWLNALEVVKLSRLGTNFVFLVAGSLSAMLLARPWGALIDRWGRKPVLILSTIGTVAGPWGWFFIPPGNWQVGYVVATVTCVLGGAVWAGQGLATSAYLASFSEREGRSKLIASFFFIAAIGGLCGGLAGGAMAEGFKFLQQHPIQVGPFAWTNYHVCFAVGSLFRFLAIFWVLGMSEPGSKPVMEAVRELRFNVFANVRAGRLFWRPRGE